MRILDGTAPKSDTPRRAVLVLLRRFRPLIVTVAVAAAFLVGALAWYNRHMAKRDVDHLFRHVLAHGNVAVAYKHADPTFRAIYP